MKYSITKNGVCAKHLCVISESNKSVSTTEDGLVFDFGELSGWSFKTGSHCTFKTDYGCTFNTGYNCIFNTGDDCTFNTGSHCTFKTGYYCTFKVGNGCIFNTGSDCTFNTGSRCTFKTGDDCTFNTGFGCTFNTGYHCTFKVGENCSLIRFDVNGVTELPTNQTVKLKGNGVIGYEVIEEKKKVTIELTDEQIEDLRKQGIDI